MGTFLHATEGEIVCESINPKIPYFNAPIYLENKVRTLNAPSTPESWLTFMADVNRQGGRNTGSNQPSLLHNKTARGYSSHFFQVWRQILHRRRQAVTTREVCH